jgi:hypothetical protein
MADEEQARTKELNEKESQLAKHKMLQAELAKQKQKDWLRISHFQSFLIKIIGKNKNGKK